MRHRGYLTPVLFALSLGFGCDDTVVSEAKPEMRLDPTTVAFGDVGVGEVRSVDVRIENTGDGLLEITDVVAAADLNDAFSFELEADRIAPNDAALLSITFRPDVIGAANGAIEVRPAGLDAQTIVVQGTAIASVLEVEPSAIDFGFVLVSKTGEATIEVTNLSSEPQDVQFDSGDNTSVCTRRETNAFCVTTMNGAQDLAGRLTIEAGQSVLLTIIFEPIVENIREMGTLELKTCDECSARTVRLEGTGVDQSFACAPAPLDFEAVNPDTCHRRTLQCVNRSNLPATILGWSVDPRSSGTFVAVDSRTVPGIAPEASADIEVEFCPTELGEETGTILVETDAPRASARTITVALLGRGGGPNITVNPTTVAFGSVATTIPATRSVLVSNEGYDELVVTQLVVDGDASFTASPGTFALPPGGSEIVSVVFAPTAEGAAMATLRIVSNDGARPTVDVALGGTGVNVPDCSYALAPRTLEFGIIEANRTRTRTLLFENIGASDCLIYGAFVAPGAGFSIVRPPEQIVGAGQVTSIEVEFAPAAPGNVASSMMLSFSSPDAPLSIPLSGTSGDAELLLFPNRVDFGNVGVNCRSRRQRVEMYNVGAVPIDISALTIDPPSGPFTIERDTGAVPVTGTTLAPGTVGYFFVEFRPTVERGYAGSIRVPFNGGTPLVHIVELSGAGNANAVQTDTFMQLGTPKADILFLVDNSCSMGDEQASLASNFAAFIQYAQSEGIDYRIAAATLDQAITGFAEFQPLNSTTNRIITPQTPNGAMAFAANVNVGAVGPGPEMGMEAGYRALTTPLSVTHNTGFLRPGAFLSIIAVSDQPDLSPNTTDFYYRFFASIKGFQNLNKFTFSAIVGDAPGGCATAQAGPRYIDMASRTGGVFTSICSNDWARSLEDLSRTAFGFRNTFFLTGAPDIPTITVEIDGVDIPAVRGAATNWRYDSATNSVVFTPFAAPEPGTQTDIQYTTLCL